MYPVRNIFAYNFKKVFLICTETFALRFVMLSSADETSRPSRQSCDTRKKKKTFRIIPEEWQTMEPLLLSSVPLFPI